jgi:hypothetical protein
VVFVLRYVLSPLLSGGYEENRYKLRSLYSVSEPTTEKGASRPEVVTALANVIDISDSNLGQGNLLA